jgi:hypothetical protein
MPTAEGFSFWNFLADVITVFLFVVWFWLLIIVFSDLFRRHDISGWGKALWVIALLLFPYFGVFIYLITQSTGMAERNLQQAQRARDKLRQVVGFSAADDDIGHQRFFFSVNWVALSRLPRACLMISRASAAVSPCFLAK